MKLLLSFVPPAAALALMSLPFQAQRLRAQTTTPAVVTSSSSFTFGMVGIASGQTARVNALSLPTGGPIVYGGVCQVTGAFLDENGKTLQTQTQTLAQGQAVHFDLPRTVAPAGADPVEIHATVSTSFILAPAASALPVAYGSCSILPTMEVFDQATGRVSVVLENPRTMPGVLPLTAGRALSTAR